jgi:hypothetical protein
MKSSLPLLAPEEKIAERMAYVKNGQRETC